MRLVLSPAEQPIEKRVPGVHGENDSPEELGAPDLVVAAPGDVAPGGSARENGDRDHQPDEKFLARARRTGTLLFQVFHRSNLSRYSPCDNVKGGPTQ